MRNEKLERRLPCPCCPVRQQNLPLYSNCFLKIPEAEHVSVASRSGCSGAKPTAHTGFGITIHPTTIQCIRIFCYRRR
ncbi:MAG: hypothetical protein LBJ00_11305 [Planctomycetaceae bacterium]|nr:hypothetical protein [Planctomycetaceae bacterium]